MIEGPSSENTSRRWAFFARNVEFSLSFQVGKEPILCVEICKKNAKFRLKRWIYRLEALPFAKSSANWPRTPTAVRIMTI